MYGTHAANRLVEDGAACAVGPAVSLLPKRRRWESNPLEAGLQPVAVPSGSSATSSSVLARSRTWSSTFAGSRANPPHSEDMSLFSALPRNRTPSGRFEDCRADPAHSQGIECLDQESNLDLDLRRVLCDPLHHRDIQHPDLESNQDQGLRRALCDPLHHRDIHTRADDWICTSIDAVYKTAALLFGHVGIKQECEDSNPVRRLWRPLLSQEHTPVSAPGLAAGGLGVTTTLAASRSSTLR